MREAPNFKLWVFFENGVAHDPARATPLPRTSTCTLVPSAANAGGKHKTSAMFFFRNGRRPLVTEPTARPHVEQPVTIAAIPRPVISMPAEYSGWRRRFSPAASIAPNELGLSNFGSTGRGRPPIRFDVSEIFRVRRAASGFQPQSCARAEPQAIAPHSLPPVENRIPNLLVLRGLVRKQCKSRSRLAGVAVRPIRIVSFSPHYRGLGVTNNPSPPQDSHSVSFANSKCAVGP